MTRLTSAQLRPYLSSYLLNGWQEERMEITSVSLAQGEITGWIDVLEYPMPTDGQFHFSAQAAMQWVSQLGIIYGCWDNELSEKAGEVYLRNISLHFNRAISKTRNIEITLRFPASCQRRLSGSRVYYKQAHIDVENGAFDGRGSFLVPIANRATQCNA